MNETSGEPLGLPQFSETSPRMAAKLAEQDALLAKHAPLAEDILDVLSLCTIDVEQWDGSKQRVSFRRLASAGHHDLSPAEYFGTDFLVACADTIEDLKAERIEGFVPNPAIGRKTRPQFMEQRVLPTLAARITYNDMLRREQYNLEQSLQRQAFRPTDKRLQSDIEFQRNYIDELRQIAEELDRHINNFGVTLALH
jgi:hypothetical protein